MSQGIQGPYVL